MLIWIHSWYCFCLNLIPGSSLLNHVWLKSALGHRWKASFLPMVYKLQFLLWHTHYSDAILSAMTSQITGVSIVYSIVCSGTGQRYHQSSTSLAFVRGIHRNSPHKGQWRGKYFHLVTSSCTQILNMVPGQAPLTFLYKTTSLDSNGPWLSTWECLIVHQKRPNRNN